MLAGTHRNSRGDNELYDLSIAYDENEKPVVKWTVTWIGGESHVFVSDGTVVIPPVLYPRITPEKLVDWMMERLLLSSSVMKAIDRNAILSNPELEEWCTHIRQKYGRMRLKTSMDDCYGKIENPLDLPEAQEIIAQMELLKGVQFQMNSDISVYHNKTEPHWSIILDRGQDPYPPFVISCDNKR